MQQLLEYLSTMSPGQIADVGQLDSLLAACWDQFDGGNAEGMESYKLLGRMESISWNPPVLSFTIERHGGTVLGSTRAELQSWEVNVQNQSAVCGTGGHRQLEPMRPRLDVKPIAAEIVELIVNRQDDNRLKWKPDGSVRVLIGNILPSGSAVNQTLQGRRKRFRTELERLLTNHGWNRVRANVYNRQLVSSNPPATVEIAEQVSLTHRATPADVGPVNSATRATMAIVAHCDDLELGAGGTIAKLVSEGWDVHVVVIESQARLPSEERRGRSGESEPSEREADLRRSKAELREAEAIAGANVLGVERDRIVFVRASEASATGEWNIRDVVSRIHDYCQQRLGVRKPSFPFVFTHTKQDRHLHHVQANAIAGQAFKTPLLCFKVASSTEDAFDPIVGVDISKWIETKRKAFEAHASQRELRFAGGRLAVDAIHEEAREWSQIVGFPYGEYFECEWPADVSVHQLEPLVELSDSDHHFNQFIRKLTKKPPQIVQAWSASLTRLREKDRRHVDGAHHSVRIQLGANPAVRDALRSGRLPVSFSMTAIDGCAEVLATPDEKSRYAGFTRDQVECFRAEHLWHPRSDSSEPHQVLSAMHVALDKGRNQSNRPKILRTLRAAPLVPISDRRSLRLLLGQSDYFTVRTVTQIIRDGSISGLETLFPARDWWETPTCIFSKDVPPYHVSVQGIILNRDPTNGEWALLLTAYAGFIAPIAGGISVGIAEQMLGHMDNHLAAAWWRSSETKPVVATVGEEDAHIFDALERGLAEELGLQRDNYSAPLLLNASLEADMFFLTFLFLVRTELSAQRIFDLWRTAPDRDEADVLALYPLCTDADGGLGSERAIDQVIYLLGRENLDLEAYVLPVSMQRGRLGARKWHHSSRMRLYVLAQHLWGTVIESRVHLEVTT